MSSVSVVIPCYRYGHFLEQAVRSVLDDQPGVDVRVLIIDDASPDDSAEVAQKIAARDPRVEVRVHAANKGNIATFNEGLLDWAAYHFLTMWAVKLDREFGSTAREHADRLRWVLTVQNTTPEGASRRIGHDAARKLAAWFETECRMTPDEGSHRVARLAVELNMVDRPLLVKEHLVSLLNSPPPKLAEDLRFWVQGSMTSEQLLDASAAA